jgi:hypothetical protein
MSLDPKSVMEKIDVDELVKVTLDLANIDSPTGEEGAAAEYVYDWLTRQGFEARKIALYPDRPNIVATLPGTGHGRSLCFNSHLDTTIHKDEWWTSRRAADPIFHTGWREGDTLIGNGVCNCKGPMATWLLAAKAIRDSGAKLKGDLVLLSVVGEIGLEPVDEFQPPQYRDLGLELRAAPPLRMRRRHRRAEGQYRRGARRRALQDHQDRAAMRDLCRCAHHAGAGAARRARGIAPPDAGCRPRRRS